MSFDFNFEVRFGILSYFLIFLNPSWYDFHILIFTFHIILFDHNCGRWRQIFKRKCKFWWAHRVRSKKCTKCIHHFSIYGGIFELDLIPEDLWCWIDALFRATFSTKNTLRKKRQRCASPHDLCDQRTPQRWRRRIFGLVLSGTIFVDLT